MKPDHLIIFSVPSDPNSVHLSFVTCIYFVAILLRLFPPPPLPKRLVHTD